jgi:transcriptional regulator with XRE-family HTH domain
MPDFPEWLQNELDKRDWRQIDLARRSGIYPNYITFLIIGKIRPGPKFCRPIAHALDLPQEVVFRQAGLLSPLPYEYSTYTEWINIFSQLSEDNQQELIEFARIKLERTNRKPR